MKLVVISPELEDPREQDVVAALFSFGLERYHLRKPHWSPPQIEFLLRSFPAEWRRRIILHQHHELVDKFQLGGRHGSEMKAGSKTSAYGTITSRSCHEAETLRSSLGRYDSVFVSPVFPSISKPGYGPDAAFSHAVIREILTRRTPEECRTSVVALGGITAENAALCLDLGVNGVAVLGAVWHAADPILAFREIQNSLFRHAA